MKCQLTRR